MVSDITSDDAGTYQLIAKALDACDVITEYHATFKAEVFESPIVNPVDDISYCDDDGDGFHSFNFDTDITPQILNGQDPNDFQILYFKSLLDAEANNRFNRISSPYTNPSPFSSETIYARIYNRLAPNACYGVTSFELNITDSITGEVPEDYNLCDNSSIGTDTDGFVNGFILSTKDAEILGTLDPVQHEVTYHISLDDANTNTAPIDKLAPYTNLIAFSQPIFVRIVNNNNVACFGTEQEFNLVVNPLPVIKNPIPAEIEQCVSNANGLATINLTTAESNISDNPNGTFEYYEDQTATQQILNFTSYPVDANTNPPKSVWVKTISEFGCSIVSELQLILGVATNEIYDETFPVCDDFLDIDGNNTPGSNNDTDGITGFQLDENAIIANISTNPNIDVFFFESETERDELKNNLDLTNYRNTNIPNTTGTRFPIYYKLINRINNNCIGLGQIYLQVDPVPINNIVGNLQLCDNNNDGNATNGIVQTFDLNSQTSSILGTQNPLNYSITYHLSQEDANTGNNPQSSPFTNTVRDLQTIYVRVEGNGCFTAHNSFDVIVTRIPSANVAPPIELCDTDSDGIVQNINLQQQTATILGSQDPSQYSVSYHNSLLNAQTGASPLSLTNYQNTTAFRETIFVRVFNNCINSITNFDIIVNLEPLANPDNTLTDFIDCDDNSDGSDTNGIIQSINLNSKIPDILGVSQSTNDFTVTFHESQINATLGEQPLPNPYTNTSPRQTIYVRVLNKNTNCVNDNLTFEIIINELPYFEVSTPRIICLITPKITLSIENPDATGYNYTWFFNNTILGTNQDQEVSEPGIYTAIVTNTITLCERPLDIEVILSAPPEITDAQVTIIDDSNNNSIRIDTSDLGIGEYEYALTDETNSNFIRDYQETPYFEQLSGGFYNILIRDKNDCGASKLLVSIIECPRFFTPNGDGINDTWELQGANADFFPNSTILVFDRYGKLLAKTPIGQRGWDGYFRGKKMPSNDYWFTIQLVRNGVVREKKGHFSLIRK